MARRTNELEVSFKSVIDQILRRDGVDVVRPTLREIYYGLEVPIIWQRLKLYWHLLM